MYYIVLDYGSMPHGSNAVAKLGMRQRLTRFGASSTKPPRHGKIVKTIILQLEVCLRMHARSLVVHILCSVV